MSCVKWWNNNGCNSHDAISIALVLISGRNYSYWEEFSVPQEDRQVKRMSHQLENWIFDFASALFARIAPNPGICGLVVNASAIHIGRRISGYKPGTHTAVGSDSWGAERAMGKRRKNKSPNAVVIDLFKSGTHYQWWLRRNTSPVSCYCLFWILKRWKNRMQVDERDMKWRRNQIIKKLSALYECINAQIKTISNHPCSTFLTDA